MIKNKLNLAVALIAGLTLSQGAFAVDDYGTVITGLSAATATAGILAAGGLKALMNFTRAAVNKVATFIR